MKTKYGYRPTFLRRCLRVIASIFISFFRLNHNGLLATEINQMLDPWTPVRFKDFSVRFKSGDGRLRWRATTFNTEEPLMVDWLNKFEGHDVFLDIGANVGTYSVPAALLVKRVYAVELDPANCYVLKENVVENKVNEKVVILPFPASAGLDMLEIYYRDRALGDALQSVGRRQVLQTYEPNPYVLQQLCFPLDYIFRTFGLEKPTKIKIDVDGNEESVVNGAWDLISSANEVYIELNDDDFSRVFESRLLTIGFRLLEKQVLELGGSNCLFSR